MKKYTVKFKNSEGKVRKIGEADNKNEVYSIVNKFMEDRNFKSYYIRTWVADGKTIMDVGSHTEFFHVCPPLEN